MATWAVGSLQQRFKGNTLAHDNLEHRFEVKNVYEYYAKWIREGKLKVNSDWNKDLQI